MQHSPSSEANRFSARQEIPHILWNPEVHYRIHKCPSPIPVLGQINPVLPLPSHVLKVQLNVSPPSTPGSSQVVPPSGLPTITLYTPLFSNIRATCLAHLSLLDLNNRIIFGQEYRSLRSSLCNFFYSFVTSSFVGPNILLCKIISNTLSLHYEKYDQQVYIHICKFILL